MKELIVRGDLAISVALSIRIKAHKDRVCNEWSLVTCKCGLPVSDSGAALCRAFGLRNF